jgi:hypothetical protein
MTTADAAVRSLYTRLLQAWNERDADNYAALFTFDGTMIGFDGSQAQGAQILDHLRPIFEDHPTAALRRQGACDPFARLRRRHSSHHRRYGPARRVPLERGGQHRADARRRTSRGRLADHIGSTWPPIRAAQWLLEGVTVRAAGEHFTRRQLPLVRAGGFDIVEVERLKAGSVERVFARKPATG